MKVRVEMFFSRGLYYEVKYYEADEWLTAQVFLYSERDKAIQYAKDLAMFDFVSQKPNVVLLEIVE